MSLDSFRVPYGEDLDRRLVTAEDAVKGKVYKCPNCGDTLTLRKGEVRVHHFAHRAGGGCSAETVLHAVVKKLLHRRLTGCCQLPFTMSVSCPDCSEKAYALSYIPFDEVRLEAAVGSVIPDVLCLFENEPILGLEVFVSNAVSRDKAARYRLPYIEFEAQGYLNLLTGKTSELKLKSFAGLEVVCAECHLRRQAAERRKTSYYIPAPTTIREPRRAPLKAVSPIDHPPTFELECKAWEERGLGWLLNELLAMNETKRMTEYDKRKSLFLIRTSEGFGPGASVHVLRYRAVDLMRRCSRLSHTYGGIT